MKITFLGTGTSQGVPVIACDCNTCVSEDQRDKRLRSSLLIETGLSVITIDAGPDFRQQMLAEQVNILDAIIITHEHRDHISGMDDVRAFNYKSQAAINIYAEDRVQDLIMREYPYVFSEYQYPGIPKMKLNLVENYEFTLKDLVIIPIRVFHYKLPIFGYRIGNFAYITDANYIPEESKEKLFGVKYLVINALRKEAHISHFNLREALNLIQEISPKRAFITHISHQMGRYSDVSRELPANVMLAYDRLSFTTDMKNV